MIVGEKNDWVRQSNLLRAVQNRKQRRSLIHLQSQSPHSNDGARHGLTWARAIKYCSCVCFVIWIVFYFQDGSWSYSLRDNQRQSVRFQGWHLVFWFVLSNGFLCSVLIFVLKPEEILVLQLRLQLLHVIFFCGQIESNLYFLYTLNAETLLMKVTCIYILLFLEILQLYYKESNNKCHLTETILFLDIYFKACVVYTSLQALHWLN